MTVRQWIEGLERLAPLSYKCQWDNPGLLAGRGDKEVARVLIALDATDTVVEMAREWRADFLLSHHPLIFKPLKRVTDEDFIGRRLVKLLQADISYYAMHTNFDVAPGCMADMAAGRLGLLEPRPLEITGEADGIPYGIGKVGDLPQETDLKSLAEQVKQAFGLPFVTVYGAGQAGAVRRAAICPGSGRGMEDAAIQAGAKVLVTGDVGHHDGIDAAARGLAIIDGGHYGLEHMFVDFMEAYCREFIDAGVEIRKAPVEFPAKAW